MSTFKKVTLQEKKTKGRGPKRGGSRMNISARRAPKLGLGFLKKFKNFKRPKIPFIQRKGNKMMGVNRRTTQQRGMRGADRTVIVGRDLVQSISVASTTKAGDLLASHLVSPHMIADSRLVAFSGLYAKYKFEQLQFEFVGEAPTTQGGSIFGFVDVDPTLVAYEGKQALQTIGSHQGMKECKPWESVRWTLPCKRSSALFTANDITEDKAITRQQCQGKFFLHAKTDFSADLPLGSLWVHYKIVFTQPRLGPRDPNAMAIAYTATNGTYAKPLGASPTVLSFSHFPQVAYDGDTGQITLPAGTYQLTLSYGAVEGEDAHACEIKVSPTPVMIYEYAVCNASSTSGVHESLIYSAVGCVLTPSITAGEGKIGVPSATMVITLLPDMPTEAKNRMSLMTMVRDAVLLQHTINKMAALKEEKKHSVFMVTSTNVTSSTSTSCVTSSSTTKPTLIKLPSKLGRVIAYDDDFPSPTK
jgi:hypothetical protein